MNESLLGRWREPWEVGVRLPCKLLLGLLSVVLFGLQAPPARAELQPEPVPNVVRLDTPYPGHFAIVHDFGFGSLIDSSFGLVDTVTRRFKGMMSAGQFATFNVSGTRGELYVSETYHSRGSRGTRTDLVTVYDMANLAIVAEIELPPRRANIVVNKWATALTRDERYLLVFNLNPATSVTVVDLDSRRVVNEIPTPGCSLVFPTAGNDFFMLCGNGGLMQVVLHDDGSLHDTHPVEPFIDIDHDPLSEKSSRAGDTWYFVSFRGQVQPISTTSVVPKPLTRWWITNDRERKRGWRPAGWHWTASDASGDLWVAMTSKGYDGSHKDPAEEVWRLNPGTQKREQRVELRNPGLSIDVTLTEQPLLLVVSAAATLDVYDARSGKYMHSIHELGASPYMVHRMPGTDR